MAASSTILMNLMMIIRSIKYSAFNVFLPQRKTQDLWICKCFSFPKWNYWRQDVFYLTKKSILSVCAFKVSTSHLCKLHSGSWLASKLWCHKVLLVHARVKLRFMVSAEKLSVRAAYRVKLCSEAQASQWSNKKNTFFSGGGINSHKFQGAVYTGF